ncbi:amidohydrolase [Frigoribacterium sp. UYMn621]|uniref:amidohydrolase n=1 Tax=Frigoribacterium sp. UYMn621 TaxID=3156343 RepID=UPI0033979ABA
MSIDLDSIYRDVHSHPELSHAEHRTATVVATHLARMGLAVTTGVGVTGVVGVLENGEGPVVHLRADMDALPVREETGLDYASTATVVDGSGSEVPVMHACGHDMHVTCLLGAVEQLVQRRVEWSGTLVAVFQPAEETLAGALSMVSDDYVGRFPRASVVLGQHVVPLPVGIVALHAGPTMAGTDSLEIVFTGVGGHGSRPHTTIDPVVAASAAVLRLQTIVSRECDPAELAVVTVGSFHAGSKSNIIPATATLGVNVRTVTTESRTRVLDSIERMVNAEASASGMRVEPVITVVERGPATVNDSAGTERLRRRFISEFGDAAVIDPGVLTGSEDVGELARAAGAPLVFWFFGGVDPAVFAAAAASGTVDRDIPGNHSPLFAPVPEPTIANGVRNLTVAALEWFSPVVSPA